MINFIKKFVVLGLGLFGLISSAQMFPTYQNDYQYYVGVRVGPITPDFVDTEKTFLYSELKAGYRYEDSLFGVLYHRVPAQLWSSWANRDSNTFGVFYNHSLSSALDLRSFFNPHVEVNVKYHNDGVSLTPNEYILDLHVGVDVRPAKHMVVDASVGVGITHPTEGGVSADNVNFSSIFKVGVGFVY